MYILTFFVGNFPFRSNTFHRFLDISVSQFLPITGHYFHHCKDYWARLENGKIDFLSLDSSIFYCCVGISSHSLFFSLAFLRLKILAHKLANGHACVCLFVGVCECVCVCVWVCGCFLLCQGHMWDESFVSLTQTRNIMETLQRDISNVSKTSARWLTCIANT